MSYYVFLFQIYPDGVMTGSAIIDSCFDKTNLDVIYTKHTLRHDLRNTNDRATENEDIDDDCEPQNDDDNTKSSISWKKDPELYGTLNVDNLYTKDTQRQTLQNHYSSPHGVSLPLNQQMYSELLSYYYIQVRKFIFIDSFCFLHPLESMKEIIINN